MATLCCILLMIRLLLLVALCLFGILLSLFMSTIHMNEQIIENAVFICNLLRSKLKIW